MGVTKRADRETTPEVPGTGVTTGNLPGKTGTPWGLWQGLTQVLPRDVCSNELKGR